MLVFYGYAKEDMSVGKPDAVCMCVCIYMGVCVCFDWPAFVLTAHKPYCALSCVGVFGVMYLTQ